MLPFFVQPPWAWISGLAYILYDTALIFFVTRELRLFLKKRTEVQTQKKLSLTLLIPSRNEGANLLLCLQALSRQTRMPEKIIVIDDGSADQSLTLLQTQKFEGTLPLTVLAKKHSGKARSLNLALASVDTDLVITLDADTFLEPAAVEAMVRAFELNPDLKAAGGLLTPVCAPGAKGFLFETFQTFEYIRAFLARQAWSNHRGLLLVSGAFAIYDTKILKLVGAYDPTSLVEDYELIHKIYHYGYDHQIPVTVGVIPEARATTDCPNSFRQFLKQRQRWFGGFLQTIFRYRKMVGNPKYSFLGKFMLPIKSLDTLQPIYGLTALFALIYLIVKQGQIPPIVIGILVAKLSLDYVYHFYSLVLYNRWQKRTVPKSFWVKSAFVTLFEPLFFQPLRHLGALLGWFVFLRRRHEWTPLETAT